MSPALLASASAAEGRRALPAGLGELASREVADDDRRSRPVESDPSCLALTQEQGFLGKGEASVHILSCSGRHLITSLSRQLKDCQGLLPSRASCPSEPSSSAHGGISEPRGPASLPFALSLFAKTLGCWDSGLPPSSGGHTPQSGTLGH